MDAGGAYGIATETVAIDIAESAYTLCNSVRGSVTNEVLKGAPRRIATNAARKDMRRTSGTSKQARVARRLDAISNA
jgi:hypothetical protein